MRLRTRNRVYIVTSRVKCTCNTLYIAAFARRIPAFISDNNRNLFAVKLIVKLSELFLTLCKLPAVLKHVHVFIEFNL